MQVRIFTQSFDITQGGFSDVEIRDFLKKHDIVSIKDHFLTQNDLPFLIFVVIYREKKTSLSAAVAKPLLEAKKEPKKEEEPFTFEENETSDHSADPLLDFIQPLGGFGPQKKRPPKRPQTAILPEMEMVTPLTKAQSITPEPKQKKKTAPPQKKSDELNKILFNALRDWRAERCKKAGVPLFGVASNIMLTELARKKPDTIEELAKIKGFSPEKIKRYGHEIINLLQETKRIN
ncbi:HRDC domain-containing protein [Magnetococcales bacterium HHB-1]